MTVPPAQQEILRNVFDAWEVLANFQDVKERNKERLRLMDRARKVSLDAPNHPSRSWAASSNRWLTALLPSTRKGTPSHVDTEVRGAFALGVAARADFRAISGPVASIVDSRHCGEQSSMGGAP